jgi:hypothetical protein
MKRKLNILAVMLGLGPIIALAGQGACDFKLSDDHDFNNVWTGLSYHPTDSQEIDLHQAIRVHDFGDTDSRWKGATRGYYDFNYYDVNFGAGRLRPFVGANANYVYGSRVNDSLLAGPEAGLKMYVQPKTLIVVQAEYQSLFHNVDQVDEAFNDGFMVYSLGIGFPF